MAPVDETSVGGGYQSNVDILRSEIAAAEERKRKAQMEMITNNSAKDEYGFGKFVSDAVRVALPALIGYKVGGGWEGAAAGAKAGVASIGEAKKEAAAKDAEADALLGLEAKSADDELTRKTKMSDSLLMQGIKDESQQDAYAPGGYKYDYEQMKRNLGIDAAKEKQKIYAGTSNPYPQSVVDADKSRLKTMGLTDEQLAGLDFVATNRPKEYQAYLGQLRLGEKLELEKAGGTPTGVSSDTRKKISGAIVSKISMDPVLQKLDAVTANLPKDKLGKFTVAQLQSVIPLTEMQDLTENLNYLALKVISTEQGRSASDLDRQAVQDFLAGKSALATSELRERVGRLVKIALADARITLDLDKSDPKRKQAALEIEDEYKGVLPSSEEARQYFVGKFGEGKGGLGISPSMSTQQGGGTIPPKPDALTDPDGYDKWYRQYGRNRGN